MPACKLDLPRGTLDLMVLETLRAMGPLPGCGIARHVEQVGCQAVLLNQADIHVSLMRLEQQGSITAGWSSSDNKRRAEFYSITKRGSIGRVLTSGPEAPRK